MSYSEPTPKGWFSRTTPLPFTPTPEALKLVLLSGITLGNPTGNLILALFDPNIAVNLLGQVVLVHPEDFDAIVALSKKVVPIPDVEVWTTVRGGNDVPTDVLHIPLLPNTEGHAFKKIIVDGFQDGETELREPTAGFYKLPEPLVSLLAAVVEAKYIGENQGPANEELIKKVRDLLGDDQV